MSLAPAPRCVLCRRASDGPVGSVASSSCDWRPTAPYQRQHRPKATRELLICRARDSDPELPSRPRVSIPKSRAPAQPPAPVPIVHSSTYTRREDLGSQDDIDITKPVTLPKTQTPGDKDALKVVLERADENLASFEENPPRAAKAFWNVAYGPLGKVATKGLQGAARATVAVTKEAVKAGAPAAKWAVKEGAKAAISLVANSGKKTAPNGKASKTENK